MKHASICNLKGQVNDETLVSKSEYQAKEPYQNRAKEPGKRARQKSPAKEPYTRAHKEGKRALQKEGKRALQKMPAHRANEPFTKSSILICTKSSFSTKT